VFRSIFSIFRNPAAVETTQLADELLIQLEQLAAEHHERDAREGIVLLADELMARLEKYTPEHRERAAALVIAVLCPVCARRREAAKMRRKGKAEMMRCWRTKRQAAPGG
jgi:hypothetical protein